MLAFVLTVAGVIVGFLAIAASDFCERHTLAGVALVCFVLAGAIELGAATSYTHVDCTLTDVRLVDAERYVLCGRLDDGTAITLVAPAADTHFRPGPEPRLHATVPPRTFVPWLGIDFGWTRYEVQVPMTFAK